MKRNDPETAEPVKCLEPAQRELFILEKRTNNTSHVSNASQTVIYVGRNGDGYSLHGIQVNDREDVHWREY